MDIIRIILAIILPPLAAFLTVGIGLHFWINLILTLTIVAAPVAMIHALWLVVKKS